MTLRVRLEIVPHGNEDAAYEIGRLDIFNVGNATLVDGHEYRVIELTEGSGALFDGSIRHRRDLGAWALVAKVLKELEITGP